MGIVPSSYIPSCPACNRQLLYTKMENQPAEYIYRTSMSKTEFLKKKDWSDPLRPWFYQYMPAQQIVIYLACSKCFHSKIPETQRNLFFQEPNFRVTGK